VREKASVGKFEDEKRRKLIESFSSNKFQFILASRSIILEVD
jgi:hypothetical protein